MLEAMWVFFYTTSHTGGGIVILLQAAKAWAKGQGKKCFQAETAVSCWCLLIPAALVDGLHLKLLVVSEKFSAAWFGSEPGLGKSFIPSSIILALESVGTPLFWDALLPLLFGLVRYFGKRRHHWLTRKVKRVCCSWRTQKCLLDILQGGAVWSDFTESEVRWRQAVCWRANPTCRLSLAVLMDCSEQSSQEWDGAGAQPVSRVSCCYYCWKVHPRAWHAVPAVASEVSVPWGQVLSLHSAARASQQWRSKGSTMATRKCKATGKCKEVMWPNPNPALIKSGLVMGIKENNTLWGLLSLLDRRWTWQVLSCEIVREYYQVSSQNTCRGQDLIDLLLMVGKLSKCREGSMLQKWLIDSCVFQRELGGHLSCLRHRALQLWVMKTRIPGTEQGAGGAMAVSIRIMLWWQRFVFSISGIDEIPGKGQFGQGTESERADILPSITS